MEVFYSTDNFPKNCGTCVTVGTFDGLHFGHKKVLKELAETAQQKKLKSLVLTFDPHPRQVLMPEADIYFVLSKREKIEAFKKTDIDFLIVYPFSKEFASMSAEEFLTDFLCKKLNMKYLIKGFNNHFGKDRLSELSVIKDIGKKYGFGITQVEKFNNGISVSSTAARDFIRSGEMKNAAKVLGYNFYISGKVVHGRHIGTSIGFPTANILVEDKNKIVPKNGVYAAQTIISGKKYPVMLNIGSNPTVNTDKEKSFFEAHIIGFSGDIYDEEIKVEILQRIRDEKKFPSLNSLKSQLEKDKEIVVSISSVL